MDTNQLGQKEISIHTFLAEGDDTTRDRIQMLEPFQSTPSSRKVTCFNFSDFIATVKFQSTPSSRKVTVQYVLGNGLKLISIHTFLAEGDHGTISLKLPF